MWKGLAYEILQARITCPFLDKQHRVPLEHFALVNETCYLLLESSNDEINQNCALTGLIRTIVCGKWWW